MSSRFAVKEIKNKIKRNEVYLKKKHEAEKAKSAERKKRKREEEKLGDEVFFHLISFIYLLC